MEIVVTPQQLMDVFYMHAECYGNYLDMSGDPLDWHWNSFNEGKWVEGLKEILGEEVVSEAIRYYSETKESPHLKVDFGRKGPEC